VYYDAKEGQSGIEGRADDTESGSDSDTQEGDLVIREQSFQIPLNGSQSTTQHVNKNRMHNTGKTCTKATSADSRRLKAAAKALLRYDESEDMCGALMMRLQRMIARDEELAVAEHREELGVPRLAKRMRNWLVQTQGARIENGELESFVKHEVEWAVWMLEAAKTGVMHVKVKGCRCKSEWDC
jgi:hypothetical protein